MGLQLCGFPPFFDDNMGKLFQQVMKKQHDFPAPCVRCAAALSSRLSHFSCLFSRLSHLTCLASPSRLPDFLGPRSSHPISSHPTSRNSATGTAHPLLLACTRPWKLSPIALQGMDAD